MVSPLRILHLPTGEVESPKGSPLGPAQDQDI